MASLTYNFEITTEVFHVDPNNGVLDAVVKSIAINLSQANTTIMYSIAYKKSTLGSATVPETVLYDDIDAALAAYKLTVMVP